MPRLRERKPSSLYRCPGLCGRVWRGRPGAAYGCFCDALPLGTDGGKFDRPFGVKGGQIGPPRPYYPDREHRAVEFADDHRPAEDVRGGIWLA
jgi:hypothetical protein